MKPTDRARRGAADWAEIRRRIDEAGRAIAGPGTIPTERKREELANRARILARPVTAAATAMGDDAVAFDIRGETFAVDLRDVMEVFRAGEIALLPGASPPLIGVTAWRGGLLPILRILRGDGARGEGEERRRVVVLGDGHTAIGIIADEIRGTITVRHDEMRPLPEGLAMRRSHVRGITNEAVQVLDASALLHLPE